MRAPSLLLALTGLASATATYDHSLVDATGAAVPFETFEVPGLTSRRPQPISERASVIPNWCGAVDVAPISERYTRVVGTWTVPVVTPPSDGTSPDAAYYLYQWVGVDGYFFNSTCDALFQAGTGFIVSCRSYTCS
jgi:hypothetical protein